MPPRRSGVARRMDAAIDHFGQMGYRKADVCSVVNKLLKVYGKDGWSFLEDGCYLVVQEAFLEMQEEEEKLQLQVLPEQQLEQHEDDDGRGDEEEEAQLELLQAGVEDDQPLELMQAQVEEDDEPLQLELPQQEEVEENNEAQCLQGPQQDDVEENDEAQQQSSSTLSNSYWLVTQQQEAEIMEEPLEYFIPIAMVVPPSEAVLEVEQTVEVVPMLIDPPSPRAASSDLASTGTKRTRRPCYGWISDSESNSDYEEYLARRQQQVHVPAK